MKNNIIDQVEIVGGKKNSKWLNVLAIITLVIAGVRFAGRPDGRELLDYTAFVVPIALFYLSKVAERRKGQFIEWKEQEIIYNCKGNRGTLLIADIQGIDINLNSILISLKGNEDVLLNIEDFIEYENRKRIKGNFEKLQ